MVALTLWGTIALAAGAALGVVAVKMDSKLAGLASAIALAIGSYLTVTG